MGEKDFAFNCVCQINALRFDVTNYTTENGCCVELLSRDSSVEKDKGYSKYEVQ